MRPPGTMVMAPHLRWHYTQMAESLTVGKYFSLELMKQNSGVLRKRIFSDIQYLSFYNDDVI